ncbi:hypothetical protein AMETH_1894 [Amycolatopsis methanolica 239]|uniref:Uncharacterized protein n=1 Tax=Amycolatopsis methanolica 239 TaxID=1068978 RepID=A0A076MSQ9_AMYME|nr:hypothetical protein AMETH_1894 [Amycolatopsis methanolica 239]
MAGPPQQQVGRQLEDSVLTIVTIAVVSPVAERSP